MQKLPEEVGLRSGESVHQDFHGCRGMTTASAGISLALLKCQVTRLCQRGALGADHSGTLFTFYLTAPVGTLGHQEM
jgi:hypothetical protein